MKTKYDYVVVGSGLFGATIANLLSRDGLKVLIVEKRSHIGGNVYTKKVNGIIQHVYGAHIFHTSDKEVWDYINQFTSFIDYKHVVKANFKGKLYSLPFNLNTFNELWGLKDENLIKDKIKEQSSHIKKITNLEEQAISLVGTDIYNVLIKEYTEKQWGRKCNELNKDIIKRIPLSFTEDNNYFTDCYQGIPKEGYTKIIESMTKDVDILTKTSFKDFLKTYPEIQFDKIIYTGSIDEYFDYQFGKLEYRTVVFKSKVLPQKYFQQYPVINFVEAAFPYTRIIEHKHFSNNQSEKTIITYEYPKEFDNNDEPYYPIADDKNISLYKKYIELANKQKNIYFKGRLGEYKYYDMDDVIRSALDFYKEVKKY